MALWPSWSRRKRMNTDNPQDPFHYDSMSPTLKVQIIHILQDVEDQARRLGGTMSDVTVKFLRQELGVFQLVRDYCQDSFDELTKWFLNESEVDHLLDAVEFVFRICPHIGGQWAKYPDNVLSDGGISWLSV
jgi:hypothetical protein